MAKKWRYWGNCINSTAEDIWALEESEEEISWDTFKKHVPKARKFLLDIGAIWEETTNQNIRDTPFLDFYKGVFMGKPAYFFRWSRIEWIWI